MTQSNTLVLSPAREDILIALANAEPKDRPNMIRRHFLSGWEPGQMAKNYENYLRDLRVSAGMDNHQANYNFAAEDTIAAVAEAKEMLRAMDFQIIFSRNNLIWAISFGEDGYPRSIITVEANNANSMAVTAEGDETFCEMMVHKVAEVGRSAAGINISELISTKGDMRSSWVFQTSTRLIGKDHYYPWLKNYQCTLAQFIDEYAKADASGLFFYGEPGTGKSTLIRTIFLQLARKNNFLVADENLMQWEGFGTWLRQLPYDSVVGIEDADNILRSRESKNSAMSSLLNMLDGVIPNECKFVISSNLGTLEKVDFALDRRGRMYDAIKFELLTADQANEIREIDGLVRLDFSQDEQYSLADVLNADSNNLRHRRRMGGFGFNR